MQINLLPNLVINRRRQARIKQLATFGLIGWAILLVVVSAASFAYHGYESSQLSTATSHFNSLNVSVNSADNKAFRADALEIQSSLNGLSGLVSNQHKLSVIGDRLAELTPKNVRIRELDIVGDGTLTIDADGGTYNDASEFLAALKASANTPTKDYFTNAVLSGANLATTGVSFTITAGFVLAPSVPGVTQ